MKEPTEDVVRQLEDAVCDLDNARGLARMIAETAEDTDAERGARVLENHLQQTTDFVAHLAAVMDRHGVLDGVVAELRRRGKVNGSAS
jgi:hypothetical protein